MASLYPGGLDEFTNPTPSDSLDSATVPHAAQHADINDAVEAIQETLGVDPQGSAPTVNARINVVEGDIATLTTNVETAQSTADDAATAAATAQTDINTLNSALGTPTGSGLILVLSQISAEASDELVAGTDPGDVDDSVVAGYVKFNVDGVDFAFPVYAIVSE